MGKLWRFQLSYGIFFSAVIFYLALVGIYDPTIERGYLDFNVFHIAAVKAAKHVSVYDVVGHWQFKYAPVTAILFAETIGHLSHGIAKYIHFEIQLLLWFFIAFLVHYDIRKKFDKPFSFYHFLAGAALMIAFFANALRLMELLLGQINAVVFLLIYLFYRRFANDKLTSAALLLALAISFKLYACIVMPFLFFNRQWKTIALTVAWFIILNYLVAGLYHNFSFALAENIAWLKSLFASSATLMIGKENISIISFWGKFMPFKINYLLWLAATLFFLWLQFRGRRLHFTLNVALSLSFILLINPIVWVYWLPLLLPVLLYSYYVIASKKMSINWGGKNLADVSSVTQGQKLLGALLLLLNILSFNAQWSDIGPNVLIPLFVYFDITIFLLIYYKETS